LLNQYLDSSKISSSKSLSSSSLNNNNNPNTNSYPSNQIHLNQSKLPNQKINYNAVGSDQIIFSSNNPHAITMQGISTNPRKISFDLKNQTSLNLNNSNTNSSNRSNINSTSNINNNTIKNSSGIPYMNYNINSINGNSNNKILIGNSTSNNDSQKQLNYQILKTISNKNNTVGGNMLSQHGNSSGSVASNLYSNKQILNGISKFKINFFIYNYK